MIDQTLLFELGRAHKAQKDLEVLVNYKGVPVLCYAAIHSLGTEHIVLTARPPEAVCLGFATHVTVMSDLLPDSISARVESFNMLTNQVELSNVTYGLSHFGERTTVRVQPDRPIRAEIAVGDNIAAAQLADISLDGVSALVVVSHEAEWIQRRADVLLTLHLPNGTVSLNSSVRHTAPVGDSVRLGLTFAPDDPGRGGLVRYINQRRAEIMDEVKRLSEGQ